MGQRDRARHQPRSFSGALRGIAPFEGVARDASRLAFRGRPSPPKYARKRGSTSILDYVAITWLSTDTQEGVTIVAKSLSNMVPAAGFEPATP